MTAGLPARVGNVTTLVGARETEIRVKMRTKSRQMKREDEYFIFKFMCSNPSVNKHCHHILTTRQNQLDVAISPIFHII